MKKTARFVIWICSKITREEIEEIIKGLLDVLADRNPDVKPKDDFKEKYPHYREFFVDPNPPLKTPLDYTEMAAPYCHRFNLANKGEVDDIQAGDEAYIKVKGEHNYVFFFISPKRRKITAYHVDGTRDTLPDTIAMNEAIRTAKPEQEIVLVTDGNHSYPAGIHFINQNHEPNITHKKVIGLQNLDSESEKFRSFKELIERLNRTYKFHTKAAYGFNFRNGAVALTTLFVTYYNFLRPHISINYSVPIPLEPLRGIGTLQGKWAKIIQLAAEPSLN